MKVTVKGCKYEANYLTGSVSRIDDNQPETGEAAKVLSVMRARQASKDRDSIRRSCGLVKVRGALGGTYWE